MKTTHSKVMTIANKLVKEGYNRANAMAKAWVLAKIAPCGDEGIRRDIR